MRWRSPTTARSSCRSASRSLPLLPGALDYATAGVDFGGVNRNKDQLGPRATLDASLSDAAVRLLFDPQTSGGLLMAVPPGQAVPTLNRLIDDGYQAAIIGSVREGSGVSVTA